jgi:hypothetical protein
MFPLLLPLAQQLSQGTLVDTVFLRGKSAVLNEINKKNLLYLCLYDSGF